MAAEYQSRRVEEPSAAHKDLVIPFRLGAHPASGHRYLSVWCGARQSARGGLEDPRSVCRRCGSTGTDWHEACSFLCRIEHRCRKSDAS